MILLLEIGIWNKLRSTASSFLDLLYVDKIFYGL